MVKKIEKKNSFLYVIQMNQYFFKSPGEAFLTFSLI